MVELVCIAPILCTGMDKWVFTNVAIMLQRIQPIMVQSSYQVSSALAISISTIQE
jgi:hypothetical protein